LGERQRRKTALKQTILGEIMPKGAKFGGRKKGTKNKLSREADEVFETIGFCPLETLIDIAMGNWKALGYESEFKSEFDSKGEAVEVERIQLEHRLAAAKEACKYRFSQKKAVELTTKDTGFKIVVEDFSKK
jgi:hypothetical protein